MTVPRQKFEYIPEHDDSFLSLFPHRGDYLWAEHPDPGDRPQWQTESRHLLSDRLIRQGAYLYGVRFGRETNYIMVEIDSGSPYHPGNDPQAVNRMCGALEPLGLVQHIKVQSSDRTSSPHSNRRGIHLYFPFEQAQNSYQIAFAVKACLERAGFKIRDGWVEIFPHPRPYQEGKPALYRGHRLPLQHGSYLLNTDFEPIATTEAAFVGQWNHAQRRNAVDRATVEQVSLQIIRKTQFPSASAAKFNADLDAEINVGFTGPGQTNHLAGRVVMKGYIFHHVLVGCSPLEGEALVAYAVETLQSLPGYGEFCGHQHEIEKRVRDYVRAIEASDYYHYDPSKAKRSKLPSEPNHEDSPNLPTLNERRSAAAKQRILDAIADLLDKGTLPTQPTARKRAIVAYGVSPQTLDKYRDLWHPNHLQPIPSVPEIDHTPSTDGKDSESLELAQRGEEHTTTHNKLVPSVAAPSGQATRQQPEGGSGGMITEPEASELDCNAFADIKRQIEHARQQQAAARQARAEKRQEQHHQKLQSWFTSDDPILRNEGKACLQPYTLTPLEFVVTDSPPALNQDAEPANTGVDELLEALQNLSSQNLLLNTDAEPLEPIASEATDLSDLLTEIWVHVKRLNLTREALENYCLSCFGRPRNVLDESELVALLQTLSWLKHP